LNTFKLDIITTANESLLSLSLKNRKYAIAEELVNLSIRIGSRDLRLALEVRIYSKQKLGFSNKTL
jgi:hypothetical protein